MPDRQPVGMWLVRGARPNAVHALCAGVSCLLPPACVTPHTSCPLASPPACRACVPLSCAALIKEADAAVISQKALQAFHAGECSAAADAAAREDQERLDEVLEAWAGGCPASPAGAAGGGGRGGRPGRPRGGAAALPPAAAAGARALRAAGKYRHIPVEPGEGVFRGLLESGLRCA